MGIQRHQFFGWHKSLVLKSTAFHNLERKLTIKDKLNCLLIEKIYRFVSRGHKSKFFVKQMGGKSAQKCF